MIKANEKWFALEITADSAVSEAVEFALNELESLGTEINNLGKNQDENLNIIGYFKQKIDEESIQNALNYSLEIYGFSADSVKKTDWREIEDQDWLAEWKKHWKPTETEKFVIAPTWEKVKSTKKIVIRIEPSMAFGTGTHETTKLCVKAVEENYKGKWSFLDVGTGTGILAIAAAKMQNANSKNQITGCDTDADSIAIAKENAEINHVKNINFYVGSISEETPIFDFVCANLTADVILPLLPLLLEKSRKMLILSGILKEQENLIIENLKQINLKKTEIETNGEWISIKIQK